MAQGPSSAQRRAAVAKQLRDRKGRWIEMGAKVRFLVNGVERVGEVVGINGNDASVTYRGNNGKPMTAKINGKGLDVINSKASLPGANEVAPKTPKAKVPTVSAPKSKRAKVEKLTAEDLDKLPSSSEVSSTKASKTWRNYDGRWGLANRGNPAKVSSDRLASDYDDISFDPEMPANKKLVDSDPELKSWLDSKLGDSASSDEPSAKLPESGSSTAALKKLGLADEDIAKLEAAGSRKEARDIWADSDFGRAADEKFRRAEGKGGNKQTVKDYEAAQAEIRDMHPDEREDLELERLGLSMRRKNIATPESEFEGIDKRIAEIDTRMDELDKADGVDADATPDDATEAPKAELPGDADAPEAAGADDARRAELDKEIADLQEEEDFLKNSGATPAEVRAVKKQKDKLIEERDGAKKEAPAAAPVAPEAAPAKSADLPDGDSIEIDEIDDLPDGSVVRLDDTINGDDDITEFRKDKGSWVGANENEEVDLDTAAFKDYINSRDPKDIVHVKDGADDDKSSNKPEAGKSEEKSTADPTPDRDSKNEDRESDLDEDDLGRSMREEAERRSGERPSSKKDKDDDKDLRKQAEKSVGKRPSLPGGNNDDDDNETDGPGASGVDDRPASENDLAKAPVGTVVETEDGQEYEKLPGNAGWRDDDFNGISDSDLAERGTRITGDNSALDRGRTSDDETDPEASSARDELDDVDADGKVNPASGSFLDDVNDFEAASAGTHVLDNKTEEVYTKDKDGSWKNADGESISSGDLAKNTATVMDDSDAKFQRENAAPRKNEVDKSGETDKSSKSNKSGVSESGDAKSSEDNRDAVENNQRVPRAGDSVLEREDLDLLPAGSVLDGGGTKYTKDEKGVWRREDRQTVPANDLWRDYGSDLIVERGGEVEDQPGQGQDADGVPAGKGVPPMGQPEINMPEPGTRGKTGQALHTGDKVQGEDDLDKLLPGQTIADPNAPDQIWVKTDGGEFEKVDGGEKLPADEIAREAGLSGRWEVVDANAPKDDDFDVDAINADIPEDDADGAAPDADAKTPRADEPEARISDTPITDEADLDALPEGAEVVAPDGEGFVKNTRGRWVNLDSGENFSSERLLSEKMSVKQVDLVMERYTPDNAAGGVPSVADGEVGRDANGRAYVNGADGVALFEGDRVRSTKDGLEGEIVKIESNGKYVKVRGDDGKIRGRRINTVESVSGAKKDEPSSAPSDSAPAAVPSQTAPGDVPAAGPKYDDKGRAYVDSANGDPIFEGSTVVSNKDGLEGTVVKVEANGKYVKVKDADGKVRGRRATTLDVVVKVAADPGPKVFDPAKGPAQLDPEGASPDPDYENAPVPSNLPNTPVSPDWTVDDVDSNPGAGMMSRELPPGALGLEEEILPGVFLDTQSGREFVKAPDGSRLMVGQVVSFRDKNWAILEIGAERDGTPFATLLDTEGDDLDQFVYGDELGQLSAPNAVPTVTEKKTAADYNISQEEYVSAMVQAKNYKVISRPDQGAMGDVTIVELPDGSQVVVKKVRGGSRGFAFNKGTGPSAPQEEVDAEYLSGKLMEALGIQGVQVSDAGVDQQGLGILAVKVVPGVPASQVGDVAGIRFYAPKNAVGSAAEEYMESDQAKKIALLDALIGNSDRHKNNWFVDESNKMVYPIDHGFAWAGNTDLSSPFADFYFGRLSLSSAGYNRTTKAPKFQYSPKYATAQNTWTKSELLDFKSQYDLLQPEFEKRGSLAASWYTESAAILDAMIEGTPA